MSTVEPVLLLAPLAGLELMTVGLCTKKISVLVTGGVMVGGAVMGASRQVKMTLKSVVKWNCCATSR